MHSWLLRYVKNPKYTGQETYQGVPAFHYSFTQAEFGGYDNYFDWKVQRVQGNLYVSIAGRYPLHFDLRLNGQTKYSPAKDYVDFALDNVIDVTGINQPVKVSLPADYPNLVLEPAVPFPPNTSLQSIYRPNAGDIIYSYLTQASQDEFMAFYKNLAPTNGWALNTLGPLTSPISCKPCAALAKGPLQVIVLWETLRINRIVVFYPR